MGSLTIKGFNARRINRPFECQSAKKSKLTRVSTAADRPSRRSGSAHAKYSVSHHMVRKPSLPLDLAA